MESFVAWLIESSLLVLMIFGIRKIFSGRIPHAGIYALWLVILVRFMIPVNFISTPVSVANLIEERFALKSEDEPELTVQIAGGRTEEKEQQYKENISAYTTLSAGEIQQDSKLVQGQEREEADVLPRQRTKQVQDRENENSADGRYSQWMPVLRTVRIFVSVLLFLWLLVSNIRLLDKMKKNRTLCGKKETLKIYFTSVVQNPCLYGFLRPAIYLPEHLIPEGEASPEQREELEQIITHEFVHYRHRDHIWAICRIILVSVYWFNPFIWLAASASKKDAELFCDETVIRLLGEEKRFRYGEMLVRLAGDHSWGDFRYSMMPMSRRGKEMARRIRAISTRKRYSKWIIIPLSFLLLTAVGITGSTGFGPLAKEKGQTEEGDGSATGVAVDREDEPEVEQEIKEQLSQYAVFLKEHAGEKEFRYYSLAWLADNHVVLLVSDRTDQIPENEPDLAFGSSFSRIYDIVEENVAYSGEISCDEISRWIRLSDETLVTSSHLSVTHTWLDQETGGLTVRTQQKAADNEADQSGEVADRVYTEWMEDFTYADRVLFYTNPYINDKSGGEEPILLALQNDEDIYLIFDDSYEYYSNAETPEEAFENYLLLFTDSVNTGNAEELYRVLAEDSKTYEQQCALVRNYYKRGIREKVKSYSVSSKKEIDENTVEISSKESINVSYADGTSKLIKQKYCYTCKYLEQSWIISNMKAI